MRTHIPVPVPVYIQANTFVNVYVCYVYYTAQMWMQVSGHVKGA